MMLSAKNAALQGIVCLLLASCDTGLNGSEEVASSDTAPRTVEANAVTGSKACAGLEPGCACVDGSAPKACFPPAQHLDDGSLQCARGTMFCRSGTWSSCESLSSYKMQEPAAAGGKPPQPPQPPGRAGPANPGRPGAQTSALISAPTTCNLCNPDCFAARDRPTDVDLVVGNSTDVQYHPQSGGIRLRSIVDTTQRGPLDTPAVCGNGVLESVEKCDDGNDRGGDGCGVDCRLDEGWHCPAPAVGCRRSVCGDATKEGTEQCDDGNLQIGDGCTPFCALEPSCSGGVCTAVCGDGKVMPSEGCDDGNARSGDGCSATCTLEAGFTCTLRSPTPPPYMDLPVVYRDFRTSHADFEHWCCGTDTGMVANTWGTDRKPVPIIAPAQNPSLTTAANFHQWYHDDPNANLTYADRLRVLRQNDGTYVFDSASFFPLNGRGFAARGEPQIQGKNFHFTSEVRFWFQYQRGQVLTFRGDDDVWVFINGKLAVDLGGVHGALPGSVTLDASTEATYGLTAGGLYEAAVFQAERHTVQSNYRLQLAGFFFGRTECSSVCGDSIVTNDEVCDDGTNDGKAGGCKPSCKGRVAQFVENGPYWRNYDAMETCAPSERPTWGDLSWEAETPSDSNIKLEIRSATKRDQVHNASPVSIDVSSHGDQGTVNVGRLLAPGHARDPYVRVTAVLQASSDETESPVLREFSLRYRCAQQE